jgi:hypothetical protein
MRAEARGPAGRAALLLNMKSLMGRSRPSELGEMGNAEPASVVASASADGTQP